MFAVLPHINPENVAPCCDVALILLPFCVKTAKYGVESNGFPHVLFVLVIVMHHVPVAFSAGAAQAGVFPTSPPPLHAIKPTATIIQTATHTILFLICLFSF
jgi:hypothetical protein